MAGVEDAVEGEFRRKPIKVQAKRWLPPKPSLGYGAYAEAMAFFENWIADFGGLERCRWIGDTIQIRMLEGVMSADPGDWVVVGIDGEIYPVKHDIFVKTYELAE